MLCELFDWPVFETRLRRMADGYGKRFGSLLQYDVEQEISQFKKYVEELSPYIVDEIPLLRSAVGFDSVSLLLLTFCIRKNRSFILSLKVLKQPC
jgi:Adenylosuccinate synthetase